MVCVSAVLQNVAALEAALRESEAELEEKRLRFEQERQQELDNIDLERFHLQEMEDQERCEQGFEVSAVRRN